MTRPVLEPSSSRISFSLSKMQENYCVTKFRRFLANAFQELVESGTWAPEKFSPKAKQAKEERSKSGEKPSKSRQQEFSKPNKIFEISADTADFCENSYLGLCVIAFLDGSPEGSADRAKYLQVLEKAQYAPSNKGRPLKFMWIDAPCHPTFGNALETSVDRFNYVRE